ncbi:hypothetical protein BRC89_04265 [Halobacteriales archaeon QS_4_70_19]|nr:MAG: hypothetical protein BRC89_04265 [Halobacteriales archaeon QS_4_70_19]
MSASSRQDVASRGEQGSPVRLAATLVTYEDRPDRRTIYPPGTSSVARMSTWLTADADAFVDRSAMR